LRIGGAPTSYVRSVLPSQPQVVQLCPVCNGWVAIGSCNHHADCCARSHLPLPLASNPARRSRRELLSRMFARCRITSSRRVIWKLWSRIDERPVSLQTSWHSGYRPATFRIDADRILERVPAEDTWPSTMTLASGKSPCPTRALTDNRPVPYRGPALGRKPARGACPANGGFATPLQMCDARSRNMTGGLTTIVGSIKELAAERRRANSSWAWSTRATTRKATRPTT
jgi:hypothetical protein